MKKIGCMLVTGSLFFFSCGNTENKISPAKHDTIPVQGNQEAFTTPTEPVMKDGEYIARYENGALKMKGLMKDGKREGTWKSWYSNGSSWSESTYTKGKKTGKTTTWYENGQKRYEGNYTSDAPTGTWTYWDEKGKFASSQDYGKK